MTLRSGWRVIESSDLPKTLGVGLESAAQFSSEHRDALATFCNWCVENRRLTVNPFRQVAKANEKADRRRQRRALTEAELSRLLIVARLRPLAEYGRETTKEPDQTTVTRQTRSRATWKLKPLKFDELPAAVELARERLKENPTKRTVKGIRSRFAVTWLKNCGLG